MPSTDVIRLALTLKISTTQVVKTSVTVNNSPIPEFIHTRTIVLHLRLFGFLVLWYPESDCRESYTV